MRVLLPLLALALAGCLGQAPLPGPAPLAFSAPVPVSLEWPAAEPVIAVAPDGTLYVEGVGRAESPPALRAGNVNKVFRSDDDGATWADVTPQGFGQESSNDGYVAVGSDGAVYASNVFSLTFQLYRSDDRGATWALLQMPRMPALMHRHWVVEAGGVLHVTVEALPPGFATFVVGVPPPTSQAGVPNEGMYYLRSTDRGATWSVPQQIDPVVNFAGQTNMVSDAAGERLYVGRYEEPGRDPTQYAYEEGRWYLLASEDGGATWERREAFALTSELSTAVPGLALGPDGTLSMAWTQEAQGQSRLHYAASRDGGRTWASPVQPRSEGTHAMAWAVAKGDGTLGLLWFEAGAQGTASRVDAPWHVWYADVAAAAGPSPQARAVRVTQEPAHEGNICAKGPACQQGEDRRLLDYPWMALGPDGRARVAFPSTAWERASAFAAVARELP